MQTSVDHNGYLQAQQVRANEKPKPTQEMLVPFPCQVTPLPETLGPDTKVFRIDTSFK